MARKGARGLGRKGIRSPTGATTRARRSSPPKSGVQTYIPKPMTFWQQVPGRFSKADFVFDAKADAYRLPGRPDPAQRTDRIDGDGMSFTATCATYGCSDCPMKAQCTPASFRRIRRWEHEDVLDDMQHRLDRTPTL